MKIKQDCCLCKSQMDIIWSINNGVIPNLYLKKTEDEKKSAQHIFFCEKCQIIENVHNFSENDLFGNYVYRTPLTKMDDEIATYLSKFIKENEIKNIVEVAGNNGTFAKKILDLLKKDSDIKYTIIDKVPIDCKDTRINHIEKFLNKTEFNNNLKANCELVIVRHALAHNKNVVQFFEDILSILNPKNIYIENASLVATYQKKDYSQLYSEHFFSLSPYFIKKLGENFNYDIKEIRNFKIHNGSFGILLNDTKNSYVYDYQHISSKELKNSISTWTDEVKSFWLKIKNKNKKIAVWGCSAKFLFTYSALELKFIQSISYIIDSTPEKNNLFAPGTSIKVLSEDDIDFSEDIVFLIGARNFSDHIEAKILQKFPDADVYCPPF